MADVSLPEVVAEYQPSASVLRSLQNINLIAVVGASASGKTAIIELAAETIPDLHMVGNETSRARRPDEPEGLEYRFVSQEQMLASMQRGEYVQVALGKTGQLSATRLSDYPVEGTGLIAIWSSAVPTFRKLFPKLRTVFIVPDSFDRWMEWFSERSKDISEEEKAKRLSEAKISYQFALKDPDVIFILNDELERAVERIAQVGTGKVPDSQDRARQIAKNNYIRLLKAHEL